MKRVISLVLTILVLFSALALPASAAAASGADAAEALSALGYCVSGGGNSPYLWVDVKGDSWQFFESPAGIDAPSTFDPSSSTINPSSSTRIYDLHGRQIAPSTLHLSPSTLKKGLYIINGEKVVK